MKKVNPGLTLVLVYTSLLYGCATENHTIYAEPAVKTDIQKNPYNYDNTIFIPSKRYRYNYAIVKNNDTLKYVLTTGKDHQKSWRLVPANCADTNLVACLGIQTLEKKGPIIMENADYDQTEISLLHLNKDGKPLDAELTGVIENKRNIWLHPFRFHAFEILQLSPFPYIKFPFRPNRQFYWKLKLGRHWDELQEVKWKGKLTMKCTYKEEKEEEITTPLGVLRTYVVSATAKTRIGESSLVSYFNPEYGFVKLVYKNIDSSMIVITLDAGTIR